MASKNRGQPPRPEIIIEPKPDRPESDRENRQTPAFSYVYYGPKKGRLSALKLGLGLAVLMAGLFVIVVLGGLIFLGLFAVLAIVAAISRIFRRK